MNLLEVFLIISWVILFILSLDIAKRQKFNAIHVFIFTFISIVLLIFVLFPRALNWLWRLFGLQRWADLLVYSAIIFLIYISLIIIRKLEEDRSDLTKILRELAISSSKKKTLHWKLAFVVPAYNEAANIKKTIKTILEAGYENVVIINDVSKDKTLDELEQLEDDIIILSHLQNRWQGAALETGFEYLRRFGETDYVCTFDSDGQHDIHDVKKFLEVLATHEKVDMVFGSRFIEKKPTNIPFSRMVVLKLWMIFTLFFSNIALSDTHNGFRVFRSKILDTLSITIDTMGHASEIIDIVAQKKIKFKEVPVHIHYDEFTLKKWQKSSNALNIAARFLWNKFFR